MRRPHTIVFLLLSGLPVPASADPPASARRWEQKQFIITFWFPPPATDATLATLAAERFNLVLVPAEGLDLTAKHGLRAMLISDLLTPEVLDDANKRGQLDALIDRVKHHPAMEAYLVTDEPGADAFPGLGRLVEHLRRRDPRHLAYINLFPTYANEAQLGVSADGAERAKVGYPLNFEGVGVSNRTVLAYREHLKKYVEIVKPDLLSYDHYHFLKSGDGKQYFLNLALIRMAAIEAQRPFINVIQACTALESWRMPGPSEMRWLIYTTIAYGGRGISYFVYWGDPSYGGLHQNGKPGPMAKEVAALNGEITRIGPALLELESTGVYHTAPLPYGTEAIPADCPVQIVGKGEFVLGLFAGRDRGRAFVVVNRNYKESAEATLRITLAGKGIEQLDPAGGRWSPRRDLNVDQPVTIKLAAGDGRLFRVSP